jgi:hypothetical protein
MWHRVRKENPCFVTAGQLPSIVGSLAPQPSPWAQEKSALVSPDTEKETEDRAIWCWTLSKALWGSSLPRWPLAGQPAELCTVQRCVLTGWALQARDWSKTRLGVCRPCPWPVTFSKAACPKIWCPAKSPARLTSQNKNKPTHPFILLQLSHGPKLSPKVQVLKAWSPACVLSLHSGHCFLCCAEAL